jgi:hypothetical protein
MIRFNDRDQDRQDFMIGCGSSGLAYLTEVSNEAADIDR